jgi:hypothetical protein
MGNCYLKLHGRLGNQLFQIATAYSYCKKYNKTLYLFTHTPQYNIDMIGNLYSNTIFKKFKYGIATSPVSVINETSHNYVEIPFVDGDVMIQGYYQSHRYFSDVSDEFVNLLCLPDIDYIDQNSVAFHIRRGDYLNISNAGPQCNTDYFNILFEKFKDYTIDVFTDSPDYVKTEFSKFDFNTMNYPELKTLTAIAGYDIVGCSNSSFSWWASFLGKSNKQVYVPSKWMGSGDYIDIYRPDMIKI